MNEKEYRKKLHVIASEYGSRGGKALVKKRGKGYMKKIARHGASVRWERKRAVDEIW